MKSYYLYWTQDASLPMNVYPHYHIVIFRSTRLADVLAHVQKIRTTNPNFIFHEANGTIRPMPVNGEKPFTANAQYFKAHKAKPIAVRQLNGITKYLVIRYE